MNSEFNIAVHAIVYLNHKGEHVSSDELARNICTNPARIRKVLSKLKKYGLVDTKEGADGGYLFNHDASEITLEQIVSALKIKIVESSWKSGNIDMECLVASGMSSVMDNIYTCLNNKCKEYLSSITVKDIETIIFKTKNK